MEGHIMPRGKRNKKSVTAVPKSHTKSVFDSVPAAGYGDHVSNGLLLKQEGLNVDAAHYENDQTLQRAIDELINGNGSDDHQEYLASGDDVVQLRNTANNNATTASFTAAHAVAAHAVAAQPIVNSTSNTSGAAQPGFLVVNNGTLNDSSCSLVAKSESCVGYDPRDESPEHFANYIGGSCKQETSVSGLGNPPPDPAAAAFGVGSGGGVAEEDKDSLLSELAAGEHPSGSLQPQQQQQTLLHQRVVANGIGVGSGPQSMQQQHAPVSGGTGVVGTGNGSGSVGGVLERVRDMPAHWQLTPVGRGRVAPGNGAVPGVSPNGAEKQPEPRLSPAPKERIPTGFNERPVGDVPQALLNGDKNPVSALNEYGQKRGMEVRIEVVSQSGPPHNPSFCMAAFVGGRQFPVVEASNKKDGRREAAEAALRVLANNGNGWTKNNWTTTVAEVSTAPTEDPAPAGSVPEVPVRTVMVPIVQENKPVKSSAGLSWQGKNPVSALYEYGQARGQHVCIEVIEQSGPPHNPRFLMAAFMGSHQFPPVEATNKKDGRTEAAVAALRSLSQGGDAVVVTAGGAGAVTSAVTGAGGDTQLTAQPLGSEKPNGEALPQVALPMEDEVAAQSKNPISVLNEYGQTKGVTVKFDVLNQSGPPHNPRFTIAAYVGDRQFDPVEASNKKEGKRQAAETALKTLVSEGECAEWARYANGVTCEEGLEGPELNQPEDGATPQQNQEQQSVHVSAEEFAALHKNPVSALNEYGQGKGLEVRIDVLSQRGPPHNPRFTIAASLGGRRFQSVVCTNKKDGRREAADVALRTLMAEGQYKVAQGLNQGNTNSGAMDNLGHFDKMAALAHRAFNTLAVTIPDSLSGRKVLAAMIMKLTEEDDGRVISLGTGNRCITGPQMSQEGATVNDSHAEVIARRGFLRFVYQNLLEYEPGTDESCFSEEKGPNSKMKLKEGISFHLYISTAPCGDGALFSPSDASSSGVDQNVDGGEHNPTFTTGVQGLLRTKMEAGEGTIPVEQDFAGQTWDGIMHGERLRTMSCSDKICRWNILGLQGALLNHFVETIYLNSLTLGYMYNHGHLTRAVCCRLEKGGKHVTLNLPETFTVNHPGLGRVTMYDPPRETEKTKPISINWVLKDITPEVTDGSKGQVKGRPGADMVSQIAKSSLYRLFKEVGKKYGMEDCIKNTYHASKQAASDYQKAKAIMCQAFRFGGCGEWVKKPLEQDMFY